MYNNPKFPKIAEARAKQWECSKCQETFANYREQEITRIIPMAISHVILNLVSCRSAVTKWIQAGSGFGDIYFC